MNPQCTSCIQKKCFINKYCSDEWKKIISSKKSVGLYKQQQSVFSEHNIAFGIYFIYGGKVKIYNNCKDNKVHITRLASEGEMIGLRSFAENNYRVNCSTLVDSTFCFIEKNLFNDILLNNNNLAIAIIRFYAKELINNELRQKHLAYSTTKERIAEAILLIEKHFGKKIKNGVEINVNFLNRNIAELALASTDETNRVLSSFRKQKIINYNRSKKNKNIIILNPKELHNIVDNEY